MMRGSGEGGDSLPEDFFKQLLVSAHAKGATHLHIEPGAEALRMRLRIDGRVQVDRAHRPGAAQAAARLPRAGSEPVAR